MAQVLIRGLPKRVVDRLKARARANGRSLEAELRRVIEAAAGETSIAREQAVPYGLAAEPGDEENPIRSAEDPTSRSNFVPLRLEGQPLSEMIIEDRRRH